MWPEKVCLRVPRQTSILLKTELCVSRSTSKSLLDIRSSMCQMQRLSQTPPTLWLFWWSKEEGGWMARYLERQKSSRTLGRWSALVGMITPGTGQSWCTFSWPTSWVFTFSTSWLLESRFRQSYSSWTTWSRLSSSQLTAHSFKASPRVTWSVRFYLELTFSSCWSRSLFR